MIYHLIADLIADLMIYQLITDLMIYHLIIESINIFPKCLNFWANRLHFLDE